MAQLLSKKEFEEVFFEFAHQKSYESYFDALNDFVEENNLDYDTIKELLSERLYDIIKKEVENKNLLKRNYKRRTKNAN